MLNYYVSDDAGKFFFISNFTSFHLLYLEIFFLIEIPWVADIDARKLPEV